MTYRAQNNVHQTTTKSGLGGVIGKVCSFGVLAFVGYFTYCMIFPGYQPYTPAERAMLSGMEFAKIDSVETQLGCWEYRQAHFLTQRLVPWYRERAFCILE
ncbi:hypothetical protein ACQU0X_27060 [Pseudovibrio ascidiaceicola]|uniref:hypothetical protein n=1 Tax=Pseudovibrio ascidiaceicola TaxID=285279 RepID=UPI003D367737